MSDHWPPLHEIVRMRWSFAPTVSGSALRLELRPPFWLVALCGVGVAEAVDRGDWVLIALSALLFLLIVWIVARKRARITIRDGMVSVEYRCPWRGWFRTVEPLSNFAALRHRFEIITSRRQSISRHVLVLEHSTMSERVVPLFWTTNFAKVAPWQARLATVLGMPTDEIAGGRTPVAPQDVERPIAEKAAGEHFPSPPAGLQTTRTAEGVTINLPQPRAFDRRGVALAAAILALPTLAVILALPRSGPWMLLYFVVWAVLMGWLVVLTGDLGAAPPRPVIRVTLKPGGIDLWHRRLIPGRYRASVPWSKVRAAEIGPHMVWGDEVLTIRTDTACFVVRQPTAVLEWLRAAITAAANGNLGH